ncbi:MAG: GAK system XXXCH domain-containing protein [Desulfurivibrionaceae bacterium]
MKFEKTMPFKNAADFLRVLAQMIEHGNMEELKEFDLAFDDFKKMKLELKREGGQLYLKAKVKAAATGTVCGEEADEDVEADGKPKYKIVKKRLDKCFKAMGEALKKGLIPEKGEVALFIADSELMVEYPGHGDEHYDQYAKLCVQFNVACENGDLAAMQEKHAELKAMKKLCHEQYK